MDSGQGTGVSRTWSVGVACGSLGNRGGWWLCFPEEGTQLLPIFLFFFLNCGKLYLTKFAF